jgi:hypothetical protein
MGVGLGLGVEVEAGSVGPIQGTQRKNGNAQASHDDRSLTEA